MGKFDQIRPAEPKNSDIVGNTHRVLRRKKILCVENFWRNVCQTSKSSYLLEKGLLEKFKVFISVILIFF